MQRWLLKDIENKTIICLCVLCVLCVVDLFSVVQGTGSNSKCFEVVGGETLKDRKPIYDDVSSRCNSIIVVR